MTTEIKNINVIETKIQPKKSDKLIPSLRFSEFVGEWEKKKLGNLVNSISSGKIKPESEGEFSVYGSTGIIGKSSKFSHEGEYLLIARVGANAGRINRVSGKYAVTDNTLVIDSKKNKLNDTFIEGFLVKFNLNRLIFGSGQPLITGGLLKGIKINLPKLEEQEKIANFLTSVDTKIQQLTRKKETLNQYKKGVMQQLFSQQIRFKKNDGTDFPDWEEKKLASFKSLIHGDGDWILSKDISINGQFKVVQLGNIGFGNYTEKHLKTISKEKFTELKGTIINKGDLLINRMVDGNINCCILNKDGDYITSVDVCWIRENIFFNNYFMMSLILFTENQKKLLSLSSGSGRVRISKKNLFNKFIFNIPSLKEQEKIATYLSAIDMKIAKVETQISQTALFKKGLLQQLFV